jgi:hypothetical protein
MDLLPMLLAPLVMADATNFTAWPHSVQPFFLSALNTALTPADASYLGGLPLVVINHKQGGKSEDKSEEKQLAALSLVKAANASCATFFYLNSQIDFGTLKLHDEFVANGTWWLKTDAGAFVLHRSDKIFDLTVPAARDAWLATAQHALTQPYISGVFVDKANVGFGAKGVSDARMAAWNSAHTQMLHTLGAAAVTAKKRVILNNFNIMGMAGQLFERWGQSADHDGLSVQRDIERLENLTAASNEVKLLSLVRGGGIKPGSATSSPPEVCAAALAEMLLAVEAPNAAFFSCMPDFNVIHGWMNLTQNMIYDEYLGAPKAKAVVGKDGLVTRAFAGANVILNISAFTSAGGSLNSGCVQWTTGMTTGICP